jgi:RNA 3'-terminal phosphate cyclase
LTAIAEYRASRLGADVIGERGKAAERIGEEGAERLRAEMTSAATVDVHTADNLMVWAALFGGVYRIAQRTGHIETNVWVIEHFLPGAVRLDGLTVIGRAVA